MNDHFYNSRAFNELIMDAARYRMVRDLYENASDRIIAERMAQRDLDKYRPQDNAAIEGDAP